MGMEAADPILKIKTAAVIAGQLFRGPLAARPLLSISAFRAKFGLGVIWLSEVRVGGLFRVGTRSAETGPSRRCKHTSTTN